MRKSIFYGIILTLILISGSCSKKTASTGAKLIFKYKLDSTQVRLNNLGQSAPMPTGHAGMSPSFNLIGAHYIELAPTPYTALGKGSVLYVTPTVVHGNDTAIDFTQEATGKDGDIFFSMPLSGVAPGTYQYLRVSLAYQNYDVSFHMDTTISGFHIAQDFPSTVASFVGFNTYLSSYTIKTQSVTVNSSRKQGYWGAESNISIPPYFSQVYTNTGQVPQGGTTVVNPLFASSPIPAGSCVVTAAFTPSTLTITGTETSDIVVTVSLSSNKSFEWVDLNGNGKWDALSGENVTDMGIRGMMPIVGH